MNQNVFQGVNSNNLKESNRSILLSLIKKNEYCSRADLAKKSGLKPATITKIVSNFIESGIVRETGSISGEKGRRSIGLILNKDEYAFIGIRIARTYSQIGMFNLTGEILHEITIYPVILEGPHAAINKIVKSTTKFMELEPQRKKLAIGIAVPGPYFPQEGKISKLTGFPGWDEISIDEVLCSSFSIPVIVDHDANTGVLAEWWEGQSGTETGVFLYLAVGEGIGAGIVINGELFYGSYGTAGEIGHSSIAYDGLKCECGNRGCLTLYASVFNLMDYTRELKDEYPESILGEEFTFDDIVDAIHKEDPLACIALKKISKYLAIGIINAICTYSPTEIVIGDIMAKIGQPLIREIKEVIEKRTFKRFAELTKIRLTNFTEDSAFIGTGSLVLNYLFKNPEIIK